MHENHFPAEVEASTEATIELSSTFWSLIRTHLVVGSAVTAGDVAANHRLATASEISYTLAEFCNEFKKEDQEGHDFCNVFNAQMKTVAKRNCINITGKE